MYPRLKNHAQGASWLYISYALCLASATTITNSLCTLGAMGKYQTTFMGHPLVLVPFFDDPSLYHGALHLEHASKSLYLSPWYNIQLSEHMWIFQPRGRWGRSFAWPGMSFLALIFSRSSFLTIANNSLNPLSLNQFVDLNSDGMMSAPSSYLTGLLHISSFAPIYFESNHITRGRCGLIWDNLHPTVTMSFMR